MPGSAWGLVRQTAKAAISPPPHLLLGPSAISSRLHTAQTEERARCAHAVAAHVHYWDRACPGQHFEHWRYEYGWKVGFADASEFFGARARHGGGPGMGADRIGCVDVWCRKRMGESGMQGPWVWEFEHGLRAGIGEFEALVMAEG